MIRKGSGPPKPPKPPKSPKAPVQVPIFSVEDICIYIYIHILHTYTYIYIYISFSVAFSNFLKPDHRVTKGQSPPHGTDRTVLVPVLDLVLFRLLALGAVSQDRG